MDKSKHTEVKPTQVYGQEDAMYSIKVANGGAGPTGVIRALAEAFISKKASVRKDFNIAWIQSITRDSLNHLKRNDANISLTYEPILEKLMIQEKYGQHYEYIFKDHFWLVGPKEGINGITAIPNKSSTLDVIKSTLLDIEKVGNSMQKPIFITRDDGSGTQAKENELFKYAKIDLPQTSPSAWYYRMPATVDGKPASRFPADCLKLAIEMKCMTLIDRGTFLMNPSAQKDLSIYLQGTDHDEDILLNPCHALVAMQINPMTELSIEFVNFMAGVDGQNIIKTWKGIDTNANILNMPLYTPAHIHLLTHHH